MKKINPEPITHPELLAPAGSPEALRAAIAAGADAVYFGTSVFNARMNAKNFEGDNLADAIKLCRSTGVKTNITLNTLVHTREMNDLLHAVEELYSLGADALIVADLGAAMLIHRYFPDLELHASTQVAGHNSLAAHELKKLGFSRMVAARELSLDDISTLCQTSPIETEIFIHGAICVSQSGQCLASSMIGGRSGNRGECAQPCRLPYKNENGRESYALSLKDMCLAGHIPEILGLGVASLKIEGRMKAPDYVYGVTSIYRRLIDEERAATNDEIEELKRLFSRSGFTDGYFTGKINEKMLGIRTDSDKTATKNSRAEKRRQSSVPTAAPDYKRLAESRAEALSEAMLRDVDIRTIIKPGIPMTLTLASCGAEVTLSGQIPEAANNRPLTADAVAEKLTKLGGTGFKAGKVDVDISDGLMLPLSALNQLRRSAVEALSEKLRNRESDNSESEIRPSAALPDDLPKPIIADFRHIRSARVEFPDLTGIPDGFDIVFVPLEKFEPEIKANGVIIPPVVFDSEIKKVSEMLEKAKESGVMHALVSNIGHIALAKDAGLQVHGDFRLNIFNGWTAEVLQRLGFEDLIASPELTLPQLRDLGLPAVVYGRLPLMTLEKCLIRDLYSCSDCHNRKFLPLIDRMGAVFPVTRAWKHRNIVCNSVPIYMADRAVDLKLINGQHFIFTDESQSEAAGIIEAYSKGLPPKTQVRRIAK